jgi:DNA polymerase III delta prime subunit
MMANFEDKHKPTSIKQVVFETDKLASDIQKICKTSQTKPILLYGSFGLGKSTIAKLLPFEIVPNIDKFAIKWIGADSMRDFTTKSHDIEAHIKCGFYQFSCIIIDEFDNYELEFQRVLKNIVDKHKESSLFIFTTNYIDKVDKGIQSRCKKIAITPPEPERWVGRFTEICELEYVPVPSEIDIIAMLSKVDDGREVMEIIEDYCISIQAAQTKNSLKK